ncbi:MAG: UPF0489 family protein [Candidatus Omnitrophica bacterium]|nr:UPF0489 family protein [Candidatus Omnitrophota bacterium]
MAEILNIEDHDQAYYAWKQRGLKGRTLVHIDAHMDFGRIPDMDLEEIAKVEGRQEMEHLLSRQPAWNPYSKKKEKMVHIGNYIYPAMRDGIVDKFYWVVPDPSWRTRRGRNRIKRNINWNKDTIVSSLESLKTIEEPVLLDIDVDFMLTPFIWKDQGQDRTPWIFPQELVKQLNDKKIVFDIATISYSVNGGYTPLRFKYLGDELKSLLEGRQDYRQSEASVCFNSCLTYLNSRPPDLSKAQELYQKAVMADKTYGCAYNNYGIIFQEFGKLNEAKREYSRFLQLDQANIYALTGLGFISLWQKKYPDAQAFFQRALKVKPDHEAAIFGEGILKFKAGEFREAEERFLKVYVEIPQALWWLACIAQREGRLGEVINYYKKAALAGEDGPLLHGRLALFYLKKRNFLRFAEEMHRLADFLLPNFLKR